MNLNSKMINKKQHKSIYEVRFYAYKNSNSKLNYIVVVALLLGKSKRGHKELWT